MLYFVHLWRYHWFAGHWSFKLELCVHYYLSVSIIYKFVFTVFSNSGLSETAHLIQYFDILLDKV